MTDVNWPDWFKADYVARLATWSDIQEQMPLLHEAALRYTRPEIAELGTRTGQSTSALLAGASVTGGHVWSVDIGEVTVPDWWGQSGYWSFLNDTDMGQRALDWVPAELDLLFIDTSHLYDHTLAELQAYVPRVRPGGTVLCHDPLLTHRDGVMGEEWIRQAMSGPEFPVAAALDTYCARAGLTWSQQAGRPAPAPPDKPFYGLGTIKIPPKAKRVRARAS